MQDWIKVEIAELDDLIDATVRAIRFLKAGNADQAYCELYDYNGRIQEVLEAMEAADDEME